MLHMQHAQLALILMERSEPKIQFPSEDRAHQRQLERVRDSLLLRSEVRSADPQSA